MTGPSRHPPFTYSVQPASTNAPNKYPISYRSGPVKAPTTYTTAIVTPAAPPVAPWTVYQWRSAAQQYYQQARQLQREKEAWKLHYTNLYRAHLETHKALRSAQSARHEAEKLARTVIALSVESKKS